MSPVHVIVGEDVRAEAMWQRAFTGAVDLYRFERNVDAFERLTAAEAPIDLVILTPAQRGPFNLTPDQFIARVLEGPLGASRCLAKLHVIVVGQSIQRSHPRVMAVSTLDAAIRLVKFGEIESAPRPAPPLAAAPHVPPVGSRTSRSDVSDLLGELPFSGSVISRIWDAPDPVDAVPAIVEPLAAPSPAPVHEVLGGGPANAVVPATGLASDVPAAAAQLFARSTAPGFVLPKDDSSEIGEVRGGGGAMMQVGAPGEAIEVASGTLQAARSYQLPSGGGYRGPALRGGAMHGAGQMVSGQPVPPAVASQVHSMVYGPSIGNPNDPLLVWSSAMRDQSAVPGAPAISAPPVGVQPMQAQPQPRLVPMDPPAGAYGALAAAAPSQQIIDPFLQRAEQGGAGISFG